MGLVLKQLVNAFCCACVDSGRECLVSNGSVVGVYLIQLSKSVPDSFPDTRDCVAFGVALQRLGLYVYINSNGLPYNAATDLRNLGKSFVA